eukprot:gene5005-3600_t
MRTCSVPTRLLRFLPSTTDEWAPLLRRVLARPLNEVSYPPHFFVQSIDRKISFCPHKPLIQPRRNDIASAVLLLLAPAGDSEAYRGPGGGRPALFQDLSITVTKRSMHIRHHRGEMSFPGGHLESGESPTAAALRETREEIGLEIDPSLALGCLTCIPSVRGYPVVPVVALSPRPLFPYCASPDEVDSIHYLHLSNILLRSNETHCRVLKCRSRTSNQPCYFPCYFASKYAETPSESAVRAVEAQPVVPRTHPADGPFRPLLPDFFPGEVVWGLTNFITGELVARIMAELRSVAEVSADAPPLLHEVRERDGAWRTVEVRHTISLPFHLFFFPFSSVTRLCSAPYALTPYRLTARVEQHAVRACPVASSSNKSLARFIIVPIVSLPRRCTPPTESNGRGTMLRRRREDLLELVFSWYQRVLATAGLAFLIVSLVVLWPREPLTMQEAIRRVDEAAVRRSLAIPWARSQGKAPDHPAAYYLSEMAEDSSYGAINILRLLAERQWMGGPNDHVLPYYHPLTCAYRQRRYNVAKHLVATAAKGILIPEVYASYLDCGDIQHLDTSAVTLVTFMGERRECVLQYPRRVPFASSRLHQHLEARGLLQDHFDAEPRERPPVRLPPRRIPATPLAPGAWDSAFFPPPVGVLPPHGSSVMNPACFDDLLEAVRYYVMGSLHYSTSSVLLKFVLWLVLMCCTSTMLLEAPPPMSPVFLFLVLLHLDHSKKKKEKKSNQQANTQEKQTAKNTTPAYAAQCSATQQQQAINKNSLLLPSAVTCAETVVAGMEAKAARLLADTLLRMSDFQPPHRTKDAAEAYAAAVVKGLKDLAPNDKEEFKDRLLEVLTNITNLDGEIAEGDQLTPEAVAGMDAAEMRSAKQKRVAAAELRKRGREQQTYDKTSMYCSRCGLVRRDRLNINQMGLDSEENGTQFEYNFGNLCECAERSSSESDDEEEGSDGDGAPRGPHARREGDNGEAQTKSPAVCVPPAVSEAYLPTSLMAPSYSASFIYFSLALSLSLFFFSLKRKQKKTKTKNIIWKAGNLTRSCTFQQPAGLHRPLGVSVSPCSVEALARLLCRIVRTTDFFGNTGGKEGGLRVDRYERQARGASPPSTQEMRREAQEVLQALRRDVKMAQQDPDVAAGLERAVTANERLCSRHAPPFRFIPLPTAPAARIDWEAAARARATTRHAPPSGPAPVPAPAPAPRKVVRFAPVPPARGERAMPAQHADPLKEWRSSPQLKSPSRLSIVWDVERERAVRDYLRRLMILSRGYDEPRLRTTRQVFDDALYNGTAMSQLVRCALSVSASAWTVPAEADRGSRMPATPFPQPQSIAEVKANYKALGQLLSGAAARALEVPEATVYQLSPERVYLEEDRSAVLELYTWLISTRLPLPQDLPAHGLCHQRPADAVLHPTRSPATYAAYESFLCHLLTSHGALPDPDTYALPGDDCLVPGPEGAKFIGGHAAARRHTDLLFAPRRVPPAAFFVPSVYPYLTNGVSLVRLAVSLMAGRQEAPAVAELRDFSLNPKTPACCRRTVALAVRLLCGPGQLSAADEAETVEEIFEGNRLRLLEFLWGAAERWKVPRDPQGPPVSPAATPSHARQPVPTTEKTVVARPSAPLPTATSDMCGPREQRALHEWLLAVLGPPRRPVAEGQRLAPHQPDALTLASPCFLFSDGVALAQLIRALERRRCDALESVKPTSKRAAKRFNVRRCLRFLQEERGMTFAFPLMDEKLLQGDQAAVLSLLRALRQAYGAATAHTAWQRALAPDFLGFSFFVCFCFPASPSNLAALAAFNASATMGNIFLWSRPRTDGFTREFEAQVSDPRLSPSTSPTLPTMVLYAGIDLGTSSVKVALMSGDGKIVDSASVAVSVSSPKPLWMEQDPAAWWAATNTAMAALKSKGANMKDIAGIGLSGQMHGATLLDKNGKVLRPCILWCDGRCAAECAELERAVPNAREITGNLIMPGFTAGKLLWVKRHEPQVFAQVAKVLLPKDYVRFLMTGDYASDMSDSSGTMWMNTKTRTWSEEMIRATGLTPEHMPRLFEGSEITGYVKEEVARQWGIGRRVPVVGGGGDNEAGAVGSSLYEAGAAMLSLGTSGVYFKVSDGFAANTKEAVHSFCHALPKSWHLMSVMLSCSACLDWGAHLTGCASVGEFIREAEKAKEFEERPVYFLPYLSGERTPHNNANAMGAFFGLTAHHGRPELARAILEGVSFAMAQGMDAVHHCSGEPSSISLIGGGSRSRLWRQMLADVSGYTLQYCTGAEVGPALGACRLAQIAVEKRPLKELLPPLEVKERHSPNAAMHEKYAKRRKVFERLYKTLYPLMPSKL